MDVSGGPLAEMESLPPELILHIAGYLLGADLVALSGTNRRFSNILSHERRLWKHRLEELKFPGDRYCLKIATCLIIAECRVRVN